MNQKQICETFSKGDFEAVYDHFADRIRWNIVGDQEINGKSEVMAHCRKMLESMEGAVLTNTRVLEDGDSVAVEGYCRFVAEGEKLSEVNYCDLYRFEKGALAQITSYCIAFTIH